MKKQKNPISSEYLVVINNIFSCCSRTCFDLDTIFLWSSGICQMFYHIITNYDGTTLCWHWVRSWLVCGRVLFWLFCWISSFSIYFIQIFFFKFTFKLLWKVSFNFQFFKKILSQYWVFVIYLYIHGNCSPWDYITRTRDLLRYKERIFAWQVHWF